MVLAVFSSFGMVSSLESFSFPASTLGVDERARHRISYRIRTALLCMAHIGVPPPYTLRMKG